MSDVFDEIKSRLFELQDEKYRDFQCSLMPTVPKEKVIGVRVPEIRALAKEFAKRDDIGVFLSALPHRYYEENNLHAFIIKQTKDLYKVVKLLDAFLPYVDNWATCDGMSPKFFKKNYDLGYEFALKCLESDKTYVNRYGIDIFMTCFLDDKFSPDHFKLILSVQNDEYYVKMMKAWYFATALSKQPESAISVFENGLLDEWTHNKAIQKAIESFRVDDEKKEYLRSLRRK